jgi:hypothetical protein
MKDLIALLLIILSCSNAKNYFLYVRFSKLLFFC